MDSLPPPLPARPAIKEILSGESLPGGKGAVTEKQMADLLAPVSGISSGLLLLSMKAGEALGSSLHLKAARKNEHLFPYAYAPVIRAMAHTLGSLKNEITAAFDTPHGAVIEARMSADFFSLNGVLLFEIHEISPVDVKVTAHSEINGQAMDWGKGERAMKRIFEKTSQFLALMSP